MQKFLPIRSATDRRLSTQGIFDALIADKWLSPALADAFLIPARTSINGDSHPLALIAAQSWKSSSPPHQQLTLEVLGKWLADKIGLPYLTIDPLKIDVAAVGGVVTHAYASRYSILPVAVDKDSVTVATAEPFIRDWEEELTRLLKRRVIRVLASPEDIARYLPEFYNLSRFVKKASAQVSQQSILQNFEQLVELGQRTSLDANDHHVVALVDWVFQYAFEQRASDIHIEPRREMGNIRFRIDGVLHSAYQVPSTVMGAIIARVKALGRMDLAEKRRPQDGRIKTKTPDNREIELRLSTMPTAFGEKLVMRIFDPQILIRNYSELGFSSEDHATWNRFISRPHGIVLVTGPTGSGKTTTLYTTLKQLASDEVNVCTIEDPIEMIEPSFNQMQVQSQIDLDFASGVRTLLRQDPDIIMVGEIRDRETAEMAVQAALTGHLVLSTLHTNDATSAVIRLIELGVPDYLISASLVGVMAQRLVRTLCPHCKQPGELDEVSWNELLLPYKAPVPARVFQPKGCLECRMTGYRGRIGLYEMLTITPDFKRLISRNTAPDLLRKQAVRDGLKPLKLAGAQKIAAGLTTLEEVIKVVPTDQD
ncbi:GspE/PulE family protein [Leeia oryzae]|uniref:GspE/PulE family protein n=1 Tax=Leeia oryzae TaxID=356662 RepID=UPI00037336F9|nr:GspE/PulE family protein [Leeia oryzae]